MRKIGILGGTFDPIHQQHIRIAKLAYQKLQLDQIWIVPTIHNPLKNVTVASDMQRLTMIKIAIANYDFMQIVDYEMLQPTKINYTIDTIQHFRKNFSDVQFYFLIGADNLVNLHQWKGIDELAQLVQFVVVNRKNYSKSHKIMERYHCQDLQVLPSTAHSSTLIRSGEIVNCLNREVLNYINDNLIYAEPRLRHHLDESRYQHSINVGLMSQKLAKHYQEDEQAALIAGTYHDLAKQWSLPQLKHFLKTYYPAALQYHHNLYHAYAAAFYLKHHYHYHNQAIISAVMKHTAGSVTMTKLDLIVFLADKISCERNYRGIEQLRTLAFESLEAAFRQYLINLQKKLSANNEPLSAEFKAVYQKWGNGETND